MKLTTNQTTNLRIELQKEFVRRRKVNANYSMRAYAKALDINQSFLSKIMNGQRSISPAIAERIVPKLKIKATAAPLFLYPYLTMDSVQYSQMAEDEVSLLSEWSHFAILELIKTKNFKSDLKWMASRLGLHNKEVQDSLERLARMKFIAIENGGITLLKPNNNWTNNVATSIARQELQKELLKKAHNAVESVEFSKRENVSLTVSITKDRLPEFKERINKLRDELDAYFQPSSDQEKFDEVYQLTIAFFPLTQELKK
ncbi:MAG: TIGR02147 family protein [Bdellovibrionota bacterium]